MSTTIQDHLAAIPPEAHVGFYAKNMQSGKKVERLSDETFGTASVIKIAIALALFKMAERGEIDPMTAVFLTEDDRFDIGYDDCGVLKAFDMHHGISLFNACILMLSISDNAATNLLLRFVPQKLVNELLNQWGFHETRLTIEKLSTSLVYAPDNYVGVSTPVETVRLLEGIVNATFVNREHSDAILQMMTMQSINHKIPRHLPTIRNVTTPHAEILSIASKTGEISSAGISNDAAVIRTTSGQTLIMSIYTQGINDPEMQRRIACIDHRSARWIAELSLTLYRQLS